MNSLGRCVWAVGFLAFLAASFGCREEPLGISMLGTFAVTGSRNPPPNYEPSFTVQGGGRTAALSGNFWGTECGRRLVPEFFRNEDQLTFRLTFVPIDVPCPQVVLVSDYEVAFQAVPAGQYQIRVVYDSEGADDILRFDAGDVTVR